MTSLTGNQGMRGFAGAASGQNNTGSQLKGDMIPKGYNKGRLANYTPEMMDQFQSLFQHVGPQSYLSRIASGDQSGFEEMEAPARRQFQQLQGNIASRFSGAGMGARGGSGFKNSMNQATSDFAMDLQSRRQEFQRQAIRDLMGLSGDLLNQRPYENFLVEKPQKPKSNWGGAIGAGLGGLMGAMGGPFGAVQGANFGAQIGNAF